MTRSLAMAAVAAAVTAQFALASDVSAATPEAGLSLPTDRDAFTRLGHGLRDRAETAIDVHGWLRGRGEVLGNFDLDRGLTPSGQPLFPVPLSDPSAQTLRHADMRLRTDIDVFAPRGGVAVHLRLDLLDNVGLGDTPAGPPLATTSQQADGGSIRIRRAWAETLTPFGVIAAGRMSGHWGLGMLSHGGDGLDSDSGDANDRIAFATPLLGLIWAAAWDFSAAGPSAQRTAPGRTIDLDPRDDVRSVSFAVMRWEDELARARRARAGQLTFHAGLLVSHRWQEVDVPSVWLGSTAAPTATSVVPRGFRATAADLWLRLEGSWLRIEAEAAVLAGTVDQATLVPGILMRDPIEALQLGVAVQSDFGRIGAANSGLSGGLDGGYASGDPAPGFGASQPAGAAAPTAGDLDGPQADPPRDTRLDAFRFHPDYRVDRILFREIVGRVVDALYLRPHLAWRIADFGNGRLELELAATASWAVAAESTPGGASALGVELDPTVSYISRDGFDVRIEGGVLWPGAGFDNPDAGLAATTAWMTRVRLGWRF